MNCSLCCSAGEMPLPVRKEPGGGSHQLGKLRAAHVGDGGPGQPGTFCTGKPPGPLRTEEPLAGSPVAPESLKVAGARGLFL